MRTILLTGLATLLFCASPVITHAKPTPPPKATASAGSSFETAIVVPAKSEPAVVKYEYDYIRTHYPRSRVSSQALTTHRGKPYDIMNFTTADGKRHTLYFDISRYFGHF
jgi:hypothetical protein